MTESISENNSRKGRPKGSKDKNKRVSPKRPAQQPMTEPGENTRFLLHDLKLMKLPKVNVNDPAALSARVQEYFSICAEDDIKPSVASFALSLGISRQTLFTWLSGKVSVVSNPESMVTLKNAYDMINSYYEHMMNNGKINPVAGIFLMKNNLGYKDQTDYVVSAGNSEQLRIEDIADRAGLLNE